MQDAPHCRVTTIETPEQLSVLAVEGEISIHTVCPFREALQRLLDGGARQIVVDLTRVSFLDSTALGVLVSAQRRLLGGGGSLLVASCEPIAQLLRTVGLDRLFAMTTSRDESLVLAAQRATGTWQG